MTKTENRTAEKLRTGIVLGGGGSRGSYEIGVLQTLTEQGETFDVVTGTSIGAICGAIFLQGDISGLEDWIGSFTQESVARNLFLFPNQYSTQILTGKPANDFFARFSKDGPQIGPLREKLEHIFDYDKFSSSPMEFACLTYNVTQERPQPFHKQEMTKENAIDILLASAAYFPAFNFIVMNGDYYIDGGFSETNPIGLNRSMGVEKLTVIDVQDDTEPDPQLEPGDRLIRPIWHLAYYLDFDGPTLKKQVALGRLDALKYLDQAPGYLYTFYPEDWKHIQRLEKMAMEMVASQGESYLLEQMPSVMDQIYTFILGYVPRPLHNKYANEYIFGRILECMGLIAGIDPAQQIHFDAFLRELLKKFQQLDDDPNSEQAPKLYHAMEMKGLQDMLVFFHTAINSYDGRLPDGFGILKEKYLLPYYLAWGWHLMEKFRLFLLL